MEWSTVKEDHRGSAASVWTIHLLVFRHVYNLYRHSAVNGVVINKVFVQNYSVRYYILCTSMAQLCISLMLFFRVEEVLNQPKGV